MRLLTIVLALALYPFLGSAQNTVTGKVVDELGLPIYLASISLENTDVVAHTDFDGNFSLSSNKDFHWKMDISSSGYETESFFVLDGGHAGEIILRYNAEMRELLIGDIPEEHNNGPGH